MYTYVCNILWSFKVWRKKLNKSCFCFSRLGLARVSAAYWCGLWGIPSTFPSPGWRGPNTLLWLSTRFQHPWEIPAKQSGTQMQPEEKGPRFHKGQARTHPLQACYLVWGSAPSTFWHSPAGGYWQRFGEEGWWLVWPLCSGTHTTVRACFCKQGFSVFWNHLHSS